MKYSAEKIGKIIKKERLKLNWSQEALGKELGQKSGAKQISKYENGTLPPIEVLLKLCEIFNCELGYLLGEENYSSGTKINTSINNLLGLSNESIDSIKHITGTQKKCINFGEESETYRNIINRFISNQSFISLIESIYYLDRFISKNTELEVILENKYGKETLEKAFEYYNSTTDYLKKDCSEKLEGIFYDAISDIDETISKEYDASFIIKALRYDVFISFQHLFENLYPPKYPINSSKATQS